MRRYDDPVEVRSGGWRAGHAARAPSSSCGAAGCGRCATVLAHWVETGPWWQTAGVRAVIGSEQPTDERAGGDGGPAATCSSSASCGGSRPAAVAPRSDPSTVRFGVFDLSFDWIDGQLAARRLRGLRG